MRFRYSTLDPSQSPAESLPRVPLVLRLANRAIEAHGLVDSGSAANVLPYEAGLQLGAIWDDRKANIRLAGALGNQRAVPLLVTAEIAGLPMVRLAFAWIKASDVPVVLGQTNFFVEFDVSFYRSRFEFELTPR
jgi:hypothetical protein